MSHEEASDVSRSWLGEVLVKSGMLTQEQLERALRIQKYLEQPKLLGAVLIELGYVTKRNISDAISLHGRGVRLGDILVEQGIISNENLNTALRVQKEEGGKLGKVLTELGFVNERTLQQNLAHQSNAPYIEPVFAMIEREALTGVSPDYLQRYKFVPFSRDEEGITTVVVGDLEEGNCVEAIRSLFNERFRLALGPEDLILQAIDDYRRYRKDAAGRIAEERAEGGGDSVVELVEHIIGSAIEERASDIHVEPLSDVIRLRYRIDGVLVYKTDLPRELLPKIVSRMKVLAECNITEHQRHQGGRAFYSHRGREYDLRISVYVTVHGESVVLRVLNKQSVLIDLEELGMAGAMLERYRTEVLGMPSGVVLITGPTGSGKTTTLYSSLNYCNSVDTKIITAEDPVEYLIDGLVQCSIHEKIGRTFEATLREIVRQDPDIIVLGEIRDRPSAQTAIQAALTGHKVYSTFHTEDTIGGLLRLIDMDIETFLISSTVISVVAQRLLRRVCSQCAGPYTPTTFELDALGLDAASVRDFELKKGRGCKYCNYTGYHSRVGIYELLVLNEEVKDAILQKKSAHAIRQICMETTGLISMCEDGVAKVIRGVTTFEEVLRRAPRTFNMRPLRQILSMTK